MVNSVLYETFFGMSSGGGGGSMRSSSGDKRSSGGMRSSSGMRSGSGGGDKRSSSSGSKRLAFSNSIQFWQLVNEKKEFLFLVFVNLIMQLGITYYVMEHMAKTTGEYNIWALFFAKLLIILILALVPMPAYLKVVLFSLFSYTFGLTLSGLKKHVNPQIIELAIIGTISIFGCMLALGASLLAFGIKLSNRFGLFLLVALFALIIFQLIFLLGQGLTSLHKIFAGVGLGLFSLYIIYDTNRLLQRDYFGDFITASLDYYLDILNIFINLVNLGDSN